MRLRVGSPGFYAGDLGMQYIISKEEAHKEVMIGEKVRNWGFIWLALIMGYIDVPKERTTCRQAGKEAGKEGGNNSTARVEQPWFINLHRERSRWRR